MKILRLDVNLNKAKFRKQNTVNNKVFYLLIIIL